MSYVRHDSDNNPVSPQPGVTTVTQFGGNEGWTSITYENYNTSYVRHDENCDPVPANTIGTYQRHDENNNAVGVGTYQRHDANNNPVTG